MITEKVLRDIVSGADLQVHPMAELMPMMEDANLREMARSILTERKLHHPILIDDDGRIVDGRNRIKALRLMGFDGVGLTKDENGQPLGKVLLLNAPGRQYVEFVPIGDDPITVLSLNLHRRHLTNAQKREVNRKLKAKFGTEQRGGSRGNQHTGGKPTNDGLPKTAAERAKVVGTSTRTVERWDAKDRKPTQKTKATLSDLEGTLSASAKERLTKAVAAHEKRLQIAHDIALQEVKKQYQADIDRLAWERLEQMLPGVEKQQKLARSNPFTAEEFKLMMRGMHPDRFGERQREAATEFYKRLQDMEDQIVQPVEPVRLPSIDEILAGIQTKQPKLTKSERAAREAALDMLKRLFPEHYHAK